MIFFKFLAPQKKENLIAIMNQGHVMGAWKPMLYKVTVGHFVNNVTQVTLKNEV